MLVIPPTINNMSAMVIILTHISACEPIKLPIETTARIETDRSNRTKIAATAIISVFMFVHP